MKRQHKHKTAKKHTAHRTHKQSSRPMIIKGESAPDPSNANVQQSEELYNTESSKGEFSLGEMGAPDQVLGPGSKNPQAMQGGLGPLGQDGEGNRQNDELSELENVESDIPKKKR